ncbi:DUF305 domain-containing protein [Sphaerisporangium aureirubrum]|uniref:DUF305 domain-containing protein n=1 Tax=Sphaerisporangium aureirubrum TaxID=1544736 RepID=A0ABW1NF24_9ACTN
MKGGRRLVSGAGLVVLLALTGCAGVPAGAAVPAGVPREVTEADVPYNLTDVLFCREMILHDRQAITLAGLVGGRTADPYVTELAREITTAEASRVEALAARLRAWQFTVPDASNPPMHDMPGMLTGAQLVLLRGKTGADFDKLWLTTLARHTGYGMLLAEKARDEGKDRATKDIARALAATQRAEVAEVATHLARLRGGR